MLFEASLYFFFIHAKHMPGQLLAVLAVKHVIWGLLNTFVHAEHNTLPVLTYVLSIKNVLFEAS